MEEEVPPFDPEETEARLYGFETKPRDSEPSVQCFLPDGTPATEEDMTAWAGRCIELADLEMRLCLSGGSLPIERIFELGGVSEPEEGLPTVFPYPTEEQLALLREEVRLAEEQEKPMTDEEFEFWQRRHFPPVDDESSYE